MPFWKNPGWFDKNQRHMQLDDYVDRTGNARYGRVELPTDKKQEAVLEHFNRVAKKYDFMNTLLSFGLHYAWKRAAVRMLELKPGQKVLDLCGGTGDLSIMSSQYVQKNGKVVLYDINRTMMVTGREKRRKGKTDPIVCIQGNGEAICFKDNSFDAVTVSFGIRNFTRLMKGFTEMHRVLKPGGKMICLEFSRPTNPFFRALYDFYSFSIMPFIGRIFTGSSRSYACLPETIRMFPLADELAEILTDIGYIDVFWKNMTNGIAVTHVGKKSTV